MRLDKWIHRLEGFIIGALVIAAIAFATVGGLLT